MKWLTAILGLLVTVSSIPFGMGQDDAPLLQDDAGDVSVALYDQSTTVPGGNDNVDLISLDLTETPQVLEFRLEVAGAPNCPNGICANGADTRTHFDFGQARYMVRAAHNANAFPVGVLFLVDETNDFNIQFVASLDCTFEVATNTYNIDIPRELLVDENGAPPRQGTGLTNIYTRAYTQGSSFGGPDPTNPQEQTDMLVVSDLMGFDEPATLDFIFGGATSNGPVELSSESPYRASNGGAATYRFEVDAINRGESTMRFDLEFDGVPESWKVERPNGTLVVDAGSVSSFPVFVTTPFGHQHGGHEVFQLTIRNQNNPDIWSTLELGIHYVTVPQPSGHHPTLWFHSEAFSESLRTVNSVLGGQGGDVWMNALEGEADGGDQFFPVQGWTGTPTNNVYRWSICLKPSLLLGLDMNLTELGSIELPLQSPRGYDEVTMEGRLIHLGPGSTVFTCFQSQYGDRDETEIATVDPIGPLNVGSSTTFFEGTVTPLAAGDFIEAEPGSMLVLELEATAVGTVPLAGPESLDLMPGGFITLPLDEFYDERPAGLISWNDDGEPEPVDDSANFIPDATPKESPGASLVGLVLALGALALMRRR